MRKTLMLGAAAFAVASFGLGAAAPSFAGPGEIILAQDRTSPGTPGTAPKGPSAADQKAEEAARERMERLKSAQPAAQAHITAEALIRMCFQYFQGTLAGHELSLQDSIRLLYSL